MVLLASLPFKQVFSCPCPPPASLSLPAARIQVGNATSTHSPWFIFLPSSHFPHKFAFLQISFVTGLLSPSPPPCSSQFPGYHMPSHSLFLAFGTLCPSPSPSSSLPCPSSDTALSFAHFFPLSSRLFLSSLPAPSHLPPRSPSLLTCYALLMLCTRRHLRRSLCLMISIIENI